MRSLASILLTGVCVLSFQAAYQDAEAKSPHSWSGAISVGVSTDRNAGAGGGKVRGGSSAREDDDEDEDDDSDEDEDEAVFDDDDLTGDDLLEDLDLDDDDLQDELDELEDEEDGIIGNEDFDGDGLPDGDGEEDTADAGNDGGDAADADAGGDAGAREFPAGFTQSAMTRRPPKGKRGDRLTYKLGAGHKYQIDKEMLWKSGLSYNAANQRQNNKNDNSITALSTGPEFKALGGDLTWGPTLAYARLVKDEKHIFDLYAAALGAKYKFNKNLGVKGKYTYDTTNFASSKPDDSYGQKIAFAVAAKPWKKATTELGWSFKTVDLTPAEKEKDKQEIKWKFQQDFAYKIFVVGEAAYKWTDFDVAKRREPIREDEEYNFGLSLGKEVYKGMNVELQYDHRKFDTNIRHKDTSNDRWALVTGWKF